jgi:hypothetical protein
MHLGIKKTLVFRLRPKLSGKEIVHIHDKLQMPINMSPCWTNFVTFYSFPTAFLTLAFAYSHKCDAARWRDS